MDIATFNKKLAEKITDATLFEKASNTKAAVKTWLDISEMTLMASKDSSLEIAFRNMLISKAEQIVQHIKDLKGRVPEPAELSTVPQSTTQMGEFMEDLPSVSNYNEEPSHIEKTADRSPPEKPKIKEDSNLKGVPKGFTEIEPSKDFKILTPHDPGIVQKRIEQAENMDIFKGAPTQDSDDSEREDTMPAEHIELDSVSEGGSIICFACGYDKNPTNSEICTSCGTKIK